LPEDRHRDHITKVVDAALPLTQEQRARLRELLRPLVIDRRGDRDGTS
jgi:hypothetical protein